MTSLLNFIMLMPPSQQGGKQSSTSMLIMLVLIVVVFYFFMIRPQVKRQKELKNFRDSLAKGDKVVTTGGIYGKITSITDQVITIDVGNSVLLKIDKNAVLKDSSDIQNEQQK
jgi:preprotein translocase subunit YajC